MKNIRLLLLIISSTFFLTCEEEDPCANVTCDNGYCINGSCECFDGYEGSQCQYNTGGSGNNSNLYGDWKRVDGLAWIRATAEEVLICAPEVTDEPQRCEWTGPNLLECNLLGSVGDWGLELTGSQLKLIPITNASTNDPAFYNRDSEFYCDNSDKGQITFYTTSDLGCGNITVTVSAIGSKEISSYYSQGVDGCGASGCANFTLKAGTYTYQAECPGLTWSQKSITISASECILYQLQ